MIPVRLELKNFMSYGENVAPVDFTGMHVACLSGENGHGKTALLDAITWALWGQARASTEELIRIGANDMSVVFDFELGGNLYRVIKAASRKRNAGVWELQTGDGAGNFRPITGQGIRDTKRQIERLLRMDYHTFINSAYIQQGKADEFTRQTVGDRKKVLADILDLSRYDELSRRAKEQRDIAEQKVETLRRELARLDSELAAEEEIRSSLSSAADDLARARRVIALEESAARTLERRKAELESDRLHALAMEQERASAKAEIASLGERLASARERVSSGEAVAARRDEITEGFRELEEVRSAQERMDGASAKLHLLQVERSGLEHAVETERHHIDLRLKMAEAELAEAEARLEERPYLEHEIESVRSQVDELEPEGAEMISREACGLERRMAKAEQMLYVISRTEEVLPKSQERVRTLRVQMESGNGSQAAERLARVDRQIAELGYDPEEHARLTVLEADLRDWERMMLELEQAEKRLADDRANVSMLEELIASKHQLVARDEEALKAADGKIAALPQIEEELKAALTELASLRSEESSLMGQCAVLEHRLRECEESRKAKAELSEKLSAAEADVSAYVELAKAFGRSGVQSLIIENAVPEIQEEANEILSRMTDGTMRISLETLRETKTSDAVETLDVRIRDEVGDRGYELLSGGEAFRVNFALRIALSKLLARRAGARLETLVIDEGFGTQDGKGREKLVEAIDAIRSDFARILVITHIEELKDAFPTRIEVVKDQDGSQVTVV